MEPLTLSLLLVLTFPTLLLVVGSIPTEGATDETDEPPEDDPASPDDLPRTWLLAPIERRLGRFLMTRTVTEALGIAGAEVEDGIAAEDVTVAEEVEGAIDG